MTEPTQGKDQGRALTSERPRDDVNDDQPYANRGAEDGSDGPGEEGEFSEGDRGDLSGRNLDQLEQVKVAPADRGGSEHAEQHEQEDDAEGNAK
jgi:hypothetical protein